jgi:hypothetical protein
MSRYSYRGYFLLARSSTALAHADRAFPARAAAASYLDLRSGATRNSSRSVSGFSAGGLPLPLFVFSMPQLCPYK